MPQPHLLLQPVFSRTYERRVPSSLQDFWQRSWRSHILFPMAALTTSSPGLYANISSSSLSFSCSTGCRYLMLQNPAVAWWTSANTSMPALRTTRLTVDPNLNTTLTAVDCNSNALSAYPTFKFPGSDSYTLDDKCNLVGIYPGRMVDGNWSYVTV
jgi:hypothetical protein